MNDILNSLKETSKKTTEAMDPVQVLFGEVTGVSPLKIKIEQRSEYDETFLILTRAVRDHEVEMTVDAVRKKYTVHNALKLADKVKLLRMQGAQQYVVIDKE